LVAKKIDPGKLDSSNLGVNKPKTDGDRPVFL